MDRKPTYEELQRRIAELEEESAARKRVEAEFKKSAARHRLIAENSGDVIFENSMDAVFLTSPEGGILRTNKAACEMFGRSEEELRRLGRAALLDSSDPRLEVALEKRSRAGFFKGELTFLRKDGSKFPGEITSAVFTGGDGQPRTSLIIRDVTERKQAEENLRENREIFNAVFNAVQTGILLIDPSIHTIIKANPMAARLCESTPSLTEGKTCHQFVCPALEGKCPVTDFGQTIDCSERVLLVKDGKEIPILKTVVPVEINSRLYLLESFIEIAARKRAEAAIRESEERSKRSAEVSRTIAELGRIISSTLSIDEVYEQFAGVVKEIIPFERLAIGIIDAKQNTYTYKHTVGIEIAERKKGNGVPLPNIMKEIVRRRTGFLLLADDRGFTKDYPSVSFLFKAGIRSIILAPLISKDEVIGTLLLGSVSSAAYTEGDLRLAEDVARQISGAIANSLLFAERERSEEALRESERRFRYIFNSANDAVFIRDLKGPFWEVNEVACKRLGYTREELLRMSPKDIVVPEALQTIQKQIRTVEQKGHLLFETVHLRKNGSSLPVEVNSRRIEYDGKPCVLSIARDITDRQRAAEEKERLQAQLIQAQKMESVGRLAGGVAHDFNNMLGIIIGNAEMAALQVTPDEPLHQSLQEIIKASHRSADTVRQLLAFARKQTISPRVLDLNDTVSGMLKMLQRLIGEDIELLWMPGKDLGRVKMDPSQVNQILANLVVNSRDAIPGVGKITIESADAVFDESYCREHAGFLPGDYVLLAVSDTGTGMSREVMEHLFDPFFTTKEVGKGTGLGLATVYGIVKQNNGFINVYSEPGKGTTFKIYFPECEGESVAVPEKPEETLPQGTETILIAEDEAPPPEIAKRF